MMNKNVKVVNLTPHAITVVRECETSDGGLETFAVHEPSGRMARCTSKTVQTGTINGIPITKTVFGDIQLVDGEGNVYPMPEICDDTIYIVSALVARASDRPDFFIVNETVRDEKGRIVGCKSFARV